MVARVAVAFAALVVIASITPASADERIVGGRDASEPYGFMGSLQTKEGGHRCGASLIAKKWVLTAAHCVNGTDPKTLQVLMGSQVLSKPKDVFEVKQVISHPSYAQDGTHDEALLRLKKPAKYPTLRIADPSEADLWAPGTDARVIGWGTDMYIVGSVQDQLKEVDVPIVSDSDCGNSYPLFFGFDAGTMVCAGEPTGGRDSCQGDSGGPLMVKDANDEWMQVGIVSWGLGCAFPMFYGVYGEVGSDPMNVWVREQIK